MITSMLNHYWQRAAIVSMLLPSLAPAAGLRLQLGPAHFNKTEAAFQKLQPEQCTQPEGLAGACPVGHDCAVTSRFRISTSGRGVEDGQPRFFHLLEVATGAYQCWSAELSVSTTHGQPIVASAEVQAGGASGPKERTRLAIFIEGPGADSSLQNTPGKCRLTIGETHACTLTLSWHHPSEHAKLVGFDWKDDNGLAEGAGGAEHGEDLKRNNPVDVRFKAEVPISRVTKTIGHPLDPPRESTARAIVRYQLAKGGPVFEKALPIAFSIEVPWYLLLVFVAGGVVAGASIGPFRAFFTRSKRDHTGWLRATAGTLLSAVILWALLILMRSSVGILDHQLRLDQTVPAFLFGGFIGWRGFDFAVQWIAAILGRVQTASLNSIFLLVLILTGQSLDGAQGSRPRQLLVLNNTLLVVSDHGVDLIMPGTPPSVRNLISFAPGATAGAAAVADRPGGKSIWVSLRLPGGRILLDEYNPDGSHTGNPVVDLSARPFGLAAPPTGMVWDWRRARLFIASGRGEIFEHRAAGSFLTASIRGRITALALDGSGQRLFAAAAQTGRVFFFGLATPSRQLRTPLAFADDAPLSDPRALAFDPGTQSLFVADEHRDSVFKLPVPQYPRVPINVRWNHFVGTNHRFLKAKGFGDPEGLAIIGSTLFILDTDAMAIFPVDTRTGRQQNPIPLP